MCVCVCNLTHLHSACRDAPQQPHCICVCTSRTVFQSSRLGSDTPLFVGHIDLLYTHTLEEGVLADVRQNGVHIDRMERH